jgi:hypothetical protein
MMFSQVKSTLTDVLTCVFWIKNDPSRHTHYVRTITDSYFSSRNKLKHILINLEIPKRKLFHLLNIYFILLYDVFEKNYI